jgi:hypothetical protein
MNARCQAPLSAEEYTLLRLKHVPNKDACPRCDGLGAIARTFPEGQVPEHPIVPCPCRIIEPRRVRVLKDCKPGNFELFAGDDILVYGWPHTAGRLAFTAHTSGSTFDGGWPSKFRELLKDGYFRFTDTNRSDVPRAAGASMLVDSAISTSPPQDQTAP